MKDNTDLYTHLERLIAQADRDFEKLEKSGDVVDLCVAFFNFRETYERIDGLRRRLYAVQNTVDRVLIPNALTSQGLDKISVPEVKHSFYVLTKYSASIKDRDATMKWLRKNGMSELITETINAGTLAARLKEMVLETGADPPECIDFKTYVTTGMSKYTPKATKPGGR